MVKITNPLTKSIYVIFEGTKYEIDAESSITVKEGVASFWVKIHPFIKVDAIAASEVDTSVPTVSTDDNDNTAGDKDVN